VHRQTILIVDDSPVSRMIMRSCLPKDLDLEVLEAGGGRAGLELHLARKPDVTFLDLTMADMSGLECLKEIKAREPAAVVVVVTADVQKRTVEAAMALGALELVPKPATKAVVAAVLRRALTTASDGHGG
jgi:DNA-binding NarL/FixJ family response regulator